MIKLQDTNVFYGDTDIGHVKDMNYIGEGFSIAIPDGSMLFIPEQDATPEEQEVFSAYHEYYKDTGGVKPETVDIESIRQSVISAMNTECNKRILAGFTSKAFDGVTEKHYDCEMTDQARIAGLVNIAQLRLMNLSNESIKWKATGELECYEWTPEQMLQLGLDMKKHIEAMTERFYALRKYCLDITRTQAELEAVTWDMVLPSI